MARSIYDDDWDTEAERESGPVIVIPTRLVVSTGKRVEPHLFMAHPTTRTRLTAWIRRWVTKT